ncbi:MAG TPA: hypothetical protein PL126_05200 [Candidatus Cloacimonadota bacterium]|nr:hypothetical protein [Candidatus Cloacimonadota bacterium]
MKVILSRKGFDSTAGGYPSPILDARELISFPIPENMAHATPDYRKLPRIRYADHKTSQGITYLDLLSQLLPPNNQNLKFREERIPLEEAFCHYDPQIYNPSTHSETPKYKGLFGQTKSALGHLVKENIGAGDLFLFFGWFRDTKRKPDGTYEYVQGTDKHVIWGWLEVERVIDVKRDKVQDSDLRKHPHFSLVRDENKVFVSKDKLSFLPDLPGAGVFQYHDKLVLTKKGMSRSKWDLPAYFKGKISYHTEASFKKDYFQSAGIGQEFVVDADDKIMKWVKNLFI